MNKNYSIIIVLHPFNNISNCHTIKAGAFHICCFITYLALYMKNYQVEGIQ